MRAVERATGLGLMLWLGVLPALAQTASPVVERQSLLHIFVKGIEWPAYIILVGSVVVIALIVEHFLTIRRITVSPPEQVKQARLMIEERRFRDCLDVLRKSSTFFARVMTAALEHARHGFEAMHEAALEKSGELSGRMFRKVEYLNIIGNLGPLLGLLGTVWGMIIAFGELAGSGGGADPGRLARGISLALVNTLLGLSLAIVGIGFFGFCRNRVDSLTVHASVEALDLLEYFRPSSSAARGAEVKKAAAAPVGVRPPAGSTEQPAKA